MEPNTTTNNTPTEGQKLTKDNFELSAATLELINTIEELHAFYERIGQALAAVNDYVGGAADAESTMENEVLPHMAEVEEVLANAIGRHILLGLRMRKINKFDKPLTILI